MLAGVKVGDHVVCCFPLDDEYFFQADGVITAIDEKARARVDWSNGMQTTPRTTPLADLTRVDATELAHWAEANRRLDSSRLLRDGAVRVPTQDEIDNEDALWSPSGGAA